MYYDCNTYLISIFSCCVVVWCVPKQCYMNIHERHFLYFGMIYFCEFQPATEMDQLQLIFLVFKNESGYNFLCNMIEIHT